MHSLKVIHGDVRAPNILVSAEEEKVWIINFEYSQIVDDDSISENSEMEKQAVEMLLKEVRSS